MTHRENRGLCKDNGYAMSLIARDQTINRKITDIERVTTVELKQPDVEVDEVRWTRKRKKSFSCISCSAVPSAEVPPTRLPAHCTWCQKNVNNLSPLVQFRGFLTRDGHAPSNKKSPFWTLFWHIFDYFCLKFKRFLSYFDPFWPIFDLFLHTDFVFCIASAYVHMRINLHESA